MHLRLEDIGKRQNLVAIDCADHAGRIGAGHLVQRGFGVAHADRARRSIDHREPEAGAVLDDSSGEARRTLGTLLGGLQDRGDGVVLAGVMALAVVREGHVARVPHDEDLVDKQEDHAGNEVLRGNSPLGEVHPVDREKQDGQDGENRPRLHQVRGEHAVESQGIDEHHQDKFDEETGPGHFTGVRGSARLFFLFCSLRWLRHRVLHTCAVCASLRRYPPGGGSGSTRGCEAGCSPQASGVPAVTGSTDAITWRRSRC